MEKYSKILIYIFILCFLNLGISSFLIYKTASISNGNAKVKTTNTNIDSLVKNSPTPVTSAKPIATDDIKTDLTQIKAEIRSLREILGISGSFEELSNLIKSLNQTDKP